MLSGMIEIRPEPFDGPDAQALVQALDAELVVRYGPGGGASTPPPEAAAFLDTDGVFLVAYYRDAAVGCGGLRIVAAADLAELNRMYVAPAMRGRGVGRAIVAALEAEALARRCVRIRLETGTSNPEAIRLYRACGYRPIRRYGPFRETAHSRCFSRRLA
jgi:GNAT superfamily N-acetyltransferase